MKGPVYLSLITATIILAANACKKGDTGPEGPQGPQGPAGPANVNRIH